MDASKENTYSTRFYKIIELVVDASILIYLAQYEQKDLILLASIHFFSFIKMTKGYHQI